MTIHSITKMWSKDGGSFSCEAYDPSSQQWDITEAYQVTCDPSDNEIDVVRASVGNNSIPLFGEPHSSGLAFVNMIQPQRVSPILWVVQVGYSGGTGATSGVNIQWSGSQTTEPIDRDIHGRAICTANGEPVDGLSMDIADQVVTIQRKFASINMRAIAPYWRATNSDTFLGWPPGTARLVDYQASKRMVYTGAVEPWDVTAKIQFREPYAGTTAEQAWWCRWRHEGLYVRVGNLICRARDHLGQERAKPVLLKADGTEETDPDAAVFIHTQVYDSLPYASLGLL